MYHLILNMSSSTPEVITVSTLALGRSARYYPRLLVSRELQSSAFREALYDTCNYVVGNMVNILDMSLSYILLNHKTSSDFYGRYYFTESINRYVCGKDILCINNPPVQIKARSNKFNIDFINRCIKDEAIVNYSPFFAEYLN